MARHTAFEGMKAGGFSAHRGSRECYHEPFLRPLLYRAEPHSKLCTGRNQTKVIQKLENERVDKRILGKCNLQKAGVTELGPYPVG